MRLPILFLCLLAASVAEAADEFVVIVNKANNQAIDQSWVAKVYLGEVKSWVGGNPIVAYDLPEDSPVRTSFSKTFLNRSIANMKVLWAQFTFSGKAVPPRQLASDEEIKKAVAANKNAMGYVSAASVDDSVRVAAR